MENVTGFKQALFFLGMALCVQAGSEEIPNVLPWKYNSPHIANENTPRPNDCGDRAENTDKKELHILQTWKYVGGHESTPKLIILQSKRAFDSCWHEYKLNRETKRRKVRGPTLKTDVDFTDRTLLFFIPGGTWVSWDYSPRIVECAGKIVVHPDPVRIRKGGEGMIHYPVYFYEVDKTGKKIVLADDFRNFENRSFPK